MPQGSHHPHWACCRLTELSPVLAGDHQHVCRDQGEELT
eukprot:CAMPEP_0181240020 /NCGR_PEP_ID=MMETSP1096-20121128/40287_1 /TAXON_ID=156174 ORGANISM="Chrysochromulina ericina, Strain CCMP281" /NCGR_SAMPLE_ID=MMETSP1096 /ASSEMBLY_ACC=CAM_ASM_000453 /LENGTH=38 /DNA_ID= /DNA_START= /DNA_END= /DNA_ORIENTATION=